MTGRRVVEAALALTFLLLAGPAAAQAQRAEAPIREVTLSNGTRRYTVPIRMGATEIEAGLDTGSTGLRILPGVLGPDDATAKGRSGDYAYGSGVRLGGDAGRGQLTVGAASGAAAVQLVRRIDCVPDQPRCPASRLPIERYGIQGDGLPGEGFKAIIGTNMGEGPIGNPLIAIGARRWIVELPRPGDDKPGRLILNPTDAETQGFVMLPIVEAFAGRYGGFHDSVQACIAKAGETAKACGPLLMDSGAPGIAVANAGLGTVWPGGTQATFAFYDAGGHLAAGEVFVVGERRQASHLSFRTAQHPPGVAIFAGLTPFFAFDVLYDPEHKAVGLRPRPPMTDGPQALNVTAAR